MKPGFHREIHRYLETTAPVLFLVLNETGRIVEANRYAEAVSGRRLIGTPFTDLVVDFAGTFTPAVFEAQPAMEHLLHIDTRSGMPQSYYFSFKPAERHVLAFGRLDTEEIESSRREVQSLNQELNNLTRQLHKANAQLDALNRLKNQFLGMAAHDLRKPVSAILNYTEFLLDEAGKVLTSEQVGFLRTIHASTALMRRVIDDFLDVSLIESGRFHLNLERTDIREPVERAAALNRLPAQRRNVTLRVVYDGPVPMVMLDDFKIEQVLNNLVSNAIEHSTPQSEVVIRVSQTCEGVTVAVTDTGPGIPRDEMDNLFAPYERGRGRKAPGTRSTGLGLSISAKIVEAHEGKIQVESRQGEGATFFFTLPLTHEARTGTNGARAYE